MKDNRYNIVFILPDQMRGDYVGCYGADFAKTPNIDKLAENGVRYERAVSPSPLCVPARASILTGYNSIINGVYHNNHWLRPDHEECGIYTWPKLLSDSGYYTAAIGKMHFYPWDISEGFDYRVISEDKRHIHIKDDYYEYLKEKGYIKHHGKDMEGYFEHKGACINPLPQQDQVDVWVADRSVDFIQDYNKQEPFAMMVGFPGPHCPYDPPKELCDMFMDKEFPDCAPSTEVSRAFRDKWVEANMREWNQVDYTDFSDEEKKMIKAYYCSLIHQIDAGVGKIYEALKKKNLLDNTIIIFASDHGDYMGDFDMVGKSHFFESSINIPMIVSHPDVKESKVYKHPVCLTDLNATIRAMAEVDYEKDNPDSIVLPEIGYGNEKREFIFDASPFVMMVIKDELKYCFYTNGIKCLYDIKADPFEQNNLIDNKDYAKKLMELSDIMTKQAFDSSLKSNKEKNVVRPDESGGGEFGERGWKRKYPVAVKKENEI